MKCWQIGQHEKTVNWKSKIIYGKIKRRNCQVKYEAISSKSSWRTPWVEHCLRTDRHPDKNNHSLYRKTENLFLCSNIRVTRPCLERHKEIHILISCSLIFCSFPFKILLLRLPNNFFFFKFWRKFEDISSTPQVMYVPKSLPFPFNEPNILLRIEWIINFSLQSA